MIIPYAVLTLLAILFYIRSTRSRKSYQCIECDETISVELMDASSCNVCGAELTKIGGKS